MNRSQFRDAVRAAVRNHKLTTVQGENWLDLYEKHADMTLLAFDFKALSPEYEKYFKEHQANSEELRKAELAAAEKRKKFARPEESKEPLSGHARTAAAFDRQLAAKSQPEPRANPNSVLSGRELIAASIEAKFGKRGPYGN